MTDGEKMIWAAAFVAARIEAMRISPRDLHRPGNEEALKKWQAGCTTSAAEVAAYSVIAAWEALPDVVDGFGEGSEVTQMLREMLGMPTEAHDGNADFDPDEIIELT